MKKKLVQHPICQRIRELRIRQFGPRGQAEFAQALRISNSTYHYYERNRVPPIEILTRIAEITRSDLNWLVRGDPLKKNNQSESGTVQQVIPILGRTAAGVPQFWQSETIPESLTQLQPEQFVGQRSGESDELFSALPGQLSQPVLIQCSQAVSWGSISVSDFVQAPAIQAKYPDLFGLRVDGESMTPQYLHGDIVLLSPAQRASNGQPAVIQLQQQIGVTCKIYRQDANIVHLIPINEKYSPTTHELSQIIWALRVLAKIRFN